MEAKVFVAGLQVLSSILLGACAEAGSNAEAPGAPNSAEVRSAEIAAQRAGEYASRAANKAAAAQRTINLSYHCNDLVVAGVVHSTDYRHQESEGDLFGHGWIRASIAVRDVISGEARGAKLSARYFAHTYLREDTDFLLVLHPDGAEGLVIEQAVRQVGGQPRLSPECRGSPLQPKEFRRG